MAVVAKSAAERKAAERARRALLGLVRLELWVRPEHAARIKAYAAKVAKEASK